MKFLGCYTYGRTHSASTRFSSARIDSDSLLGCSWNAPRAASSTSLFYDILDANEVIRSLLRLYRAGNWMGLDHAGHTSHSSRNGALIAVFPRRTSRRLANSPPKDMNYSRGSAFEP